MGVSRRLRQVVLGATTEDVLDGRRQVYLVADGDVERVDVGSGAHHRADDLGSASGLVAVVAMSERSPLRAWPVVFAAQARFGAADGGPAYDYPQMGCQAQATRMGLALSVEGGKRLS